MNTSTGNSRFDRGLSKLNVARPPKPPTPTREDLDAAIAWNDLAGTMPTTIADLPEGVEPALWERALDKAYCGLKEARLITAVGISLLKEPIYR